jgi:hypothetical protein
MSATVWVGAGAVAAAAYCTGAVYTEAARAVGTFNSKLQNANNNTIECKNTRLAEVKSFIFSWMIINFQFAYYYIVSDITSNFQII